LKDLIHSKKYRIKDPEHLRDKLVRKWHLATNKGTLFDYNKENLFSKINDLAGFRILHLHTTQFEKINLLLKKIFEEQQWSIVEGPDARTWDDESREYFSKINVTTSANPNMYTSVHYIVKPNSSSPISCEIQVRTLMEEVWGEVDHLINYPHKSNSHSCREQIKTLARVTSSCSRLVDSIFSTYRHEMNQTSVVSDKKSR
jgi:putative GTP pyrophosphokinase